MAAGPYSEFVFDYFQHLRMLLVEGFVLGDKVRQRGKKSRLDWFLVWKVSLNSQFWHHKFSITNEMICAHIFLIKTIELYPQKLHTSASLG
jgi:hypothetical protein